MLKKDPEGYQKLLVYQKAQKLHDDVLKMVKHFPQLPYRHTQYKDSQVKTIGDLADQMSRSGRSTHKNMVEGWKRNTTQEYFDFLGFSIGSNSELKDDAADIVLGKYKELMGIKGVMGEMGWLTREELDRIPFYPLDPLLPLAVKIYLQAKEVNYLLYKLQQSLDIKMDKDLTKPSSQRIRENFMADEIADKSFDELLKQHGLKRLENGQVVDDK